MARKENISSAANPLVKEVRKAIARGGLTGDGYAVAETFHLLEEALRSGREISVVLAAASVEPDVDSHLRGRNGVRTALLPDDLFAKMSATQSPQGVIALVKPPQWTLPQLFEGVALVVALDGIQDPGNAGAIARCAEAFQATGLIFLKGTVNPFNPKTLRASAGSLFRVPFVCGVEAPEARTALSEHGVSVYAAAPRSASSHTLASAELTRPCAFVIGAEGRGVSDAMREGSLEIAIPTAGVESLNAAVAAGILLYEARRQRTGT
jgi:RNA methyltransferase, TrmH family